MQHFNCHQYQGMSQTTVLCDSALRKTFVQFDNVSDLMMGWNLFSLQMDARDVLTNTSQSFKREGLKVINE